MKLESESPTVRVLAQSVSLLFEVDYHSGPYLSHLDLCVIYFTAKTLFVHCYAPFISRILKFLSSRP